MADLAATVRQAVALAAEALGGPGGVLVQVQHEAWNGTFTDSKPNHAAAIPRDAFVWTYEAMARRAKVARTMGDESVDGPQVLFLENITVHANDRLTLPDGSQPPIASILGIPDPAGGNYFVQVRCGRPERGAVT